MCTEVCLFISCIALTINMSIFRMAFIHYVKVRWGIVRRERTASTWRTYYEYVPNELRVRRVRTQTNDYL